MSSPTQTTRTGQPITDELITIAYHEELSQMPCNCDTMIVLAWECKQCITLGRDKTCYDCITYKKEQNNE